MTESSGVIWPCITTLETKIVEDVQFRAGMSYGEPRPGHPEGAVKYHIVEVLDNVQKMYLDSTMYSDLRLIAMIHDSFKYAVDREKPRSGDNHHGALASVFAQKYLSNPKVLTVITRHDDAFNSWMKGKRNGKWEKATDRAIKLIDDLIEADCIGLYIAFYKCDNLTGDKTQDNYEWFIDLAAERLGQKA